MAGDRAVHVRISGRVQGVWFRAWTVDLANDFGLDGWVRNRADGTVEALFAGPVPQVEKMIAHCHEGLPAARVDEVVREDADHQPHTGKGFRQLPTE